MTEFNLSEHTEQSGATYFDSYKIKVKYVKEFIKELKDEITIGDTRRETEDKIDKLAGDDLK